MVPKYAELAVSSCCLQCTRGRISNCHWIILKLKKTEKFDDSETNSEVIRTSFFFSRISKRIYGPSRSVCSDFTEL